MADKIKTELAEDVTIKKTQDALERLKRHQDRYLVLQEEIKECEYMINLTKKLIYNICEHTWLIDHTQSDEYTIYICNKCNSNR
jgi:uncharacterized protein YegJ (DUF2314 family)